MRVAIWQDYELIDASDGERLERWADVILIRPDPQVIWKDKKQSSLWTQANARYTRSNTGGGAWRIEKSMPDAWSIRWEKLTFRVKPMGFKHTGIFPEQAVNWAFVQERIKGRKRQPHILNLFAYTGAATLACLQAGAKVTHVDAAKGMVQWAKENAQASGLQDRPVRWMIDDCMKFVQREIRRGNRYDGIIMDPPSYGRGPGGEVWKLEEQLSSLLERCVPLLSEDAMFFLLNSYSTGLSPAVMAYQLGLYLKRPFGGLVSASEIGLPVSQTGLILPCGSTAIWSAKEHVDRI